MSMDVRLCPGCGADWHGFDDENSEGGMDQCAACGYECERPPTLAEMLAEDVDGDWADLAAFVRGVLRSALGVPDRQVADLLANIERLRTRVAELEAAARWIPVEERLPGDGVAALVFGNNAMTAARWMAGEWSDLGGFITGITYWRPLPAGPEG